MSDDYYPAPDEIRDFYMNDYDSGMPPDVEDEILGNLLKTQHSIESLSFCMNNPPAFPVSYTDEHDFNSGMTLLD